jgi:hypothetical protein
MSITLDAELESALKKAAELRGMTPEALALMVLRAKFLNVQAIEPRDEWERKLLALPVDCGVSLPDWAVSREALYD